MKRNPEKQKQALPLRKVLKEVVIVHKYLLAIKFLNNVGARAETRSLKVEASLAIDYACYGPKQSSHDKSRVHKAREKAQTENACIFHGDFT